MRRLNNDFRPMTEAKVYHGLDGKKRLMLTSHSAQYAQKKQYVLRGAKLTPINYY